MGTMLSFKEYLSESANTILADINEIWVGYVLAGNRWFDADARRQFEERIKQASPAAVEDAKGKAEAMAVDFLKWAKKAGYKGKPTQVWWTARPNSMTKAVGQEVNQKKNPTDVLIRFADGPANGFLGLSAKATKSKGDIGFKNPGIGTIDRSLNTSFAATLKDVTEDTIRRLDLPPSTKARKQFIRANKDIQKQTIEAGVTTMREFRDILLKRLLQFDQASLKKYLLDDWMDAEVLYPPYVKVTGQGKKAPYKAVTMDPLKNDKLSAFSKNDIELEPIGNESIGVKAGPKKIMKIRFKFESEKMASSLKLSGDPW